MEFFKYKDLVYEIIGAAMKVHSELGWGLLEPIYNEALHIELLERGIISESEKKVQCYYKNYALEKYYMVDMMVGDIILELKSVGDLTSAHRAQLFNYLRLTKKPFGILINFGEKSLQSERYGYVEETNECVLLDKEMNIINPNYCINDNV
ncbi:MAG: GxxExxY protein [Muribaculaceae bacterium]|nr:GxxExxY protein [Muribaculaceae bacterium]